MLSKPKRNEEITMKTTHLFKHNDRYYAKSTVESAHVEYEHTFDKTIQREMYPWYVYMQKPWGQDSYEQANWENPRSYGRVSYDKYEKTIGGCLLYTSDAADE